MADIDKDLPAADTADADEAADVIRPVTAGTELLDDDAVEGTESRPQSGGDGNGAAGDDDAVGGDACAADAVAAGEAGSRPPSARPTSARPTSARPASGKSDAARPPSATPEAARPESAKSDAARPASATPEAARPESAKSDAPRPASARPESAKSDAARPPSATPEAARPESAKSDAARPASARPTSARPPSAGAAAPAEKAAADCEDAQPDGEAAAEAGGEDKVDGEEDAAKGGADAPEGAAAEGDAEGERPSSSHSHHPDVITDITQSPEAHAELDEMAQQQAREVIRSRQNSASSERKPVSAEEAKRRTSSANASVRSATPPPAKSPPAESLAKIAMQPPSPSKIKTGPWLTGTYRLPKSGKIISGEELCDALERMTNAYIDKYTRDKDGGTTKEIAPGAATVYNTKKLTQDEYDQMISRLYKPKDRSVTDSDRIQLITLKFGDGGQEQWVPVKTVSAEDQQAYMCQLYQRCLDNRKKTQEDLAAKYLKPLGPARKR